LFVITFVQIVTGFILSAEDALRYFMFPQEYLKKFNYSRTLSPAYNIAHSRSLKSAEIILWTGDINTFSWLF
jgi:hypothetical protein